MAERTIETRAIISAEDRTGAAFAAVVAHMEQMEEAAKHASARVDAAMVGGPNEEKEQRRALLQQRTREREELRHLQAVERFTNGAARERREQLQHLRQIEEFRQGAGFHGDISGRQMLAGIVGTAIAERTAHFAHHSLETYREFDKERRYGRAVMGITDEQQGALIEQAIHGGGTTKFNDIQWLEAQRELAARGLTAKQVLALTPVAATLGQAVDKSLPDASKMLEGGMFGFGKDMATYEAALANAKRTADLQVKASKISGMTADDIVAAYKYAAAPFRMGGLTEEQMLAFAAVGKKANMPGDEMGTAGRALIAALLSPTAKARTAMLANGINFSRFQTLGPKPMDVEPFAASIAQVYGVALSDAAKKGMKKVFDDRALVQDAAKFMPAIMKVLSSTLGGDDAKAKKSIAGEARRYRDAAMSGVDAQALFNALIPAIARNPALANLVFGSKQGARIRTAIGDPEVFLQKLDELKNHSQGYADDISKQRMAGFDGAVSRFEGAVMNLESALPRAFDANGKGGFLTGVTDKMGQFTQALAEAPPGLQRLATEAGLAAAAFAGFKGAEALFGGFGLKAAAADLMAAAEALKASSLMTKGGLPGAAVVPGETGGKPSVFVPIAQVLAYEFGKQLIDEGLKALPHPAYRRGYDPDQKLNEMPWERVGDIWRETAGARNWLKSLFVTPAHAEEAPHARSPYGAHAEEAPHTRSPYGSLPSKFTPSPGLSPNATPQKVDVSISPPPPLKVMVQVDASSQLLQIAQKLQTLTVQLKAQIHQGGESGPGSLGATHTGQ